MKNRDYVADKLRNQLEPHNIAINTVWDERNRKFAQDGEVTLSAINRAKGNEQLLSMYLALIPLLVNNGETKKFIGEISYLLH